MQFSGNQLVRKRNFYTQNGNFGVAVDFSVDNPSGRYEFGLSGTNQLSVILESGQIKYNDLFIQSYIPNNDYSVLLEITDQKLNYIQNNNEIAYGLDKATGDYNYFYFKRQETGINAEFDFYLSGKNLPLYSIDKIGYWLNTGQKEVSGQFANQSGYDLAIFNSVAQGLQGLSYRFSSGFFGSGQTSNFKYSGDYSNFDFAQPIFTNFNTNFGDVSVNFTIVNVSSLEQAILLEEIDDFSFNSNNQINRDLSYSNYSGGLVTNSFNTDLFIKLDYLEGSGQFQVDDFAKFASFTGFAYGNFFESGRVTGVSFIQTGNESLTGTYSVYFNRFQWATGNVTGFFTGYGTGIASGLNYTGLSYGPISGQVVGTIRDGSGSFIFSNVLATGILFDSGAAINYTGYTNATGYINLSGVPLDSAFFIGIESTPIVKGLTYFNETGLVFYLSGNPQHKVDSYYDGSVIRLTARQSGSLGNDVFIRNFTCDPSLSSFSPNLTGGENFGETGFVVYGFGTPFTGFINSAATGSGDYRQFVSGNEPGTFTFDRTFTGAWQLYTGLTQSSLSAVPLAGDGYSGYASLNPNSSIIFQIDHQENEFNTESVIFTISGDLIVNPINNIISQ